MNNNGPSTDPCGTTTLGGMKAVLWTDALQVMFVLTV